MLKFKTTLKSYGVILICFCAMFLETLFLSYGIDLGKLDTSLFNEAQKAFYDAQSSMCMMMNIISLGILGLFSFVLLFFSIERYIEENKANMGVLKALGYSKRRIALSFMKFFLPTFIGCALGYVFAIICSKPVYDTMNADHILPDFGFTFSPLIFIGICFLPSVLVLIFAYLVSIIKLSESPLDMINDRKKNKKNRVTKARDSFLSELRSTMLKNHIPLIIFVGFAVLCFSATIQMSFTLLHQANTSAMFFWMVFGIGLLLGVTILFLSFRFVYKSNVKYMSMLKAYGYNNMECYYAMYGGYHIVSLISFFIGTGYTAGLMSIMFEQFTSTYGITYSFDFLGLLYSILIFVVFYLACNFLYYKKINKLKLDSLNADLG